jgi:hypothetical protein
VNTTQDRWMPRGLLEPAEAKSGNANAALNTVMPGWNLSHGSHYQIANRFSWAWKLAQLGVPVALVYLGFLHAEDVADVGTPLSSADQWSSLMRQHASGIVPEAAWGSRLGISGTSLVPLTRSMTIRVEAL